MSSKFTLKKLEDFDKLSTAGKKAAGGKAKVAGHFEADPDLHLHVTLPDNPDKGIVRKIKDKLTGKSSGN